MNYKNLSNKYRVYVDTYLNVETGKNYHVLRIVDETLPIVVFEITITVRQFHAMVKKGIPVGWY